MKNIVMIIIFVFVFLIVFIMVPNFIKHYSHRSGPSEITETLHRFQILCFYIDAMETFEGYKHPIYLEMIKEYRRKINDPTFKRLIYNNEICDAWNTPIRLYFEEPVKYTFISCGPNKKYEQGKGEDIIEVNDWSPYIDNENKSGAD